MLSLICTKGGELHNMNWMAIIVAAVINMVLGFLWYGPLFGKAWQKLIGLTDSRLEEMKKKGMTQTYVFTMVGAVAMAFVLNQIVTSTGTMDLMSGVMLGFWAWLGFVAPVQLSQVLYEQKSWNLYFINTGYYLVALVLMGGLLASWV